MTLQLANALALCCGCTVAIAACPRAEVDPRSWRPAVHLSSWLLALLSFVPPLAYALLRQPAWASMYTRDLSSLSLGLRATLAMTPLLAAGLGALLTVSLQSRRAHSLAVLLASISVALVAGAAVWGSDRLLRLGSLEQYQGSARSLMTPLWSHRFGLVVGLALVCALSSWSIAVITLRRRKRAQRV